MNLRKFSPIVLLLLFSLTMWAVSAETNPTSPLAQLDNARWQQSTSQATGFLTFLRAEAGSVLVADDVTDTPENRAHTFLAEFGSLFGLANSRTDLVLERIEADDLGQTHVRFLQVHQGLSVLGGEIIVHLTDEGVLGANGTIVPEIDVPLEVGISAEQAKILAAKAINSGNIAKSAANAKTDLAIFRVGLLRGFSGDNVLAYKVTLLTVEVWLNATTGETLARVPLHHSALHRVVYLPDYDPSDPTANVAREEGDPPSLIPAVNNLYDFAGQTYDLFQNTFAFDSYDGAGATMRSVYLVNGNCPNAYWNGATTNYCPGFDLDDVVAHEWGHAYTEYTHGLIYQWQSGALNEAYSDMWGEIIDLHNGVDGIGGSNNAQPHPDGQRWLLGEDLGEPVQAALLRDMWDPDRLQAPGKVTSENYHCSDSDAGGVHVNSGVPNHAFAMLVDGKMFNGQTVNALGFNKVSAIYWRAGSVYQVQSSNFADHADALEASCTDLIGAPLTDIVTGLPSADVISASDCTQVANAMLAVEMRTPPDQCNFQPLLDPADPPDTCSAGTSRTAFFSEDWETGTDGWTMSSTAASPPAGDAWPNYNWELALPLPSSEPGVGIFATDPITGTCQPGGDISGVMGLESPIITVPATIDTPELRFQHWVATEANYDGGNLKFSVDGGAYQLVPEDAYTFNPPNDTLEDGGTGQNTNPIAGEDSWSGSNGGELGGSFGITVVDLTELGVTGGEDLRFRWDFGMDGCNGLVGWYLDEIEASMCTNAPLSNYNPTEVTHTQGVDEQSQHTINIANTGQANLNWDIDEDDGATVPQLPETLRNPISTKTDADREAFFQRFAADRQPAQALDALGYTPCFQGMADAYPCDGVDLLSFMPLADIGGGEGNDIWGWTDPVTDNEYAIMGRTNGTAFVDITDPSNPIYVAELPPQTANSNWRDIKVVNDHALVVSEAPGHGMQIYDLNQLRDITTTPHTISTVPLDGEIGWYSDFGSAHNVVVNEDTDYAYAVGTAVTDGCSGGLHIVNMADPANPVNAGCYADDGYTHDAQCVIYNGPDTDHQGKEICFNSNEDTLTIVDVDDKGNMVELSRTGYTGAQYTHQGWLTDDHTYFLLDDELDEQDNGHNTRTYIWDVSDLDAPVLTNMHDAATAAIDHNLYIIGDYAYQANYRAGLRIYEISDVANGNIAEVGFFDVWPSDDNANFNGAWSNFPYYDSGVVVISGIEQGLFVVQPFAPLQPCDTPDDISWLTLSQSSGTVVPASNLDVTVTLDSTGLSAGTYEGTLCVNSNDPFNPLQKIPVTMTVSEIPTAIVVQDVGTSPFSLVPLALIVVGVIMVSVLLLRRKGK